MTYKFPISPHSYFKISNLAEEREKFLRQSSSQPVFTYGSATTDLIKKRLLQVNDKSASEGLRLVLASLRLRNSSTTDNLREFRSINEKLYDIPDRAGVSAVLQRVKNKVDTNNEMLWNEILKRVKFADFEKNDFNTEIYNQYSVLRSHFNRYANLDDLKLQAKRLSLSETIRLALDRTKTTKSWNVLLRPGDKHVRTVHRFKNITVGEDYQPRRAGAKVRIAVHEVFGHALRGVQGSAAESEGFATVLEQLTNLRFTFRRSYRYLAVALGWGADGEQRNFREVYEVLWRCIVILGEYDIEQAKYYAFNECARAFRGGEPSVAGAVFLKDAVYFSANQKVWQKLVQSDISYDEFVDIIEGRRRILTS